MDELEKKRSADFANRQAQSTKALAGSEESTPVRHGEQDMKVAGSK